MTTAMKDAGDPRLGERGYALVKASETDPISTLYLYDILGEDLFGGIPARQVVQDLQGLGSVSDLTVRINSSGGDVFEGIAVYNALVRFPAKVTVHVDGMAASIASLVAMAGNKTLVAENAMLMVHRPWTVASGDAVEMRRQADVLEKAWSAMLTTYARRTGKRASTLAQRVTDAGGEWWMTAEEAVAEGFAEGTEKAEKETQVFGLERFTKVPARLAARVRPPSGTTEGETPDAVPHLPRVAEIAAPRIVRPCAADARRRTVDILRLST